MKGLLISDISRIHRFSQKGGITRLTKCPYCGHMVNHLNRAKSNCGHIERREYPKNFFPNGMIEDRGKGQYLPEDW